MRALRLFIATHRFRLLLASIVAVAFVMPLAVVLSTAIPATAQRQLAIATPDDQPVPVDLPRAAVQSLAGVSYLHRVRLETRNVGQVADRSEIRLLVATHNTSPSLERGELAIVGTECTYHTVRGAPFPNNDHLTLRRGRGCAPLRGTPTGELRLTLRFSTPGRAALWTYLPSAGADISRDAIVIADPALPQSFARPIVRGVLVDTYPSNTARRVDLLAYVWQMSPSPAWIWSALACSGLLIGCAAFCLSALPSSDHMPRPGTITRPALGVFCAAAAFALMYVVLVPPFQAADEPNHFVSFAELIGRPTLANDATAWAERSHFERIQFHPDERFGPWDRERAGVQWDDGVAQNIGRGVGIAWLWRPASLLVGTLPAAPLLLALRLIDAGVFALTAACYVLLVGWITRTRTPELWALPLFLVPTLPFFASYVSNYSLLVDAYIMVAAGVIVLSSDEPGAAAAGPIIAASWMGGALVSRSALPLAPMIAALFVARLLIGSRARPLSSAALFWGGAGVIAAGAIALADAAYLQRISEVATQQLPPTLAAIVRSLVEHPSLAVLPAAAAAAAELAIGAGWQRVAHRVIESARSMTAWLATGAALAIALFLAASCVVVLPRLTSVDPLHPPPAAEYATRATLAGLTMLRFGPPDFLTSVAFWGGFGWLDTLLPGALVAALAGATGVALATLFLWIARCRSTRTLILVCCVIGGYVASLAAYAVSVIRTTPADLHGRYLIGLYLVLLTVAWSVVPRTVDTTTTAGHRRTRNFPEWLNRRTALLAFGIVCTGVHAYALTVILQRYF